MKILKKTPKKTIVATAHVDAIGASDLAKSGRCMVTKFVLRLNGTADSEASRGTNVYFCWLPSWLRPDFDPQALALHIDKLNDSGDAENLEVAKELSSTLFMVKQNIAMNPSDGLSVLRGLVGGRSIEENNALFDELNAKMSAIGAAYPGSDDETEDMKQQDAIVAEVDKVFAETFLSDNSVAGKYIGVTFGHANETEKDAEGNIIRDSEGKAVTTVSQYRNVLQWFLPTEKRLASWRKSCEKEGAKISYAIDDALPWG